MLGVLSLQGDLDGATRLPSILTRVPFGTFFCLFIALTYLETQSSCTLSNKHFLHVKQIDSSQTFKVVGLTCSLHLDERCFLLRKSKVLWCSC